jgi:hypothetical protein
MLTFESFCIRRLVCLVIRRRGLFIRLGAFLGRAREGAAGRFRLLMLLLTLLILTIFGTGSLAFIAIF